MDLIGCLIVVGLVIVSSVSCSEHRPDQLWTEAMCEVTCLEKEGYVDTSSLTQVFKTDIIPLAKAHVTHSPRFLKKNVNSGCKCKIKTNNPDLVKYFNRMGAPLMQFKIYHKLRGSHHAREWLKKHNITVQFPHRPESETLSGSQKHKWTEENCEAECWRKEGYLDVRDIDIKYNKYGLTEVEITNAQLVDKKGGKTECKCTVNSSNMYLTWALKWKNVDPDIFFKQHQRDPYMARLWLASKGFKVRFEPKVCDKDCITSDGWVLLPQEHTGHRTRIALSNRKMVKTPVFRPILDHDNKTISVHHSEMVCKCVLSSELLEYLQQKGHITKPQLQELNKRFELGNDLIPWLYNHFKLEIHPAVDQFKEEKYKDEFRALRPKMPKRGPIHRMKEDDQIYGIREDDEDDDCAIEE
nr:PREDICTED: uncharacterized protein LOC109034701 isoform X2 [Bemisia tabaci]